MKKNFPLFFAFLTCNFVLSFCIFALDNSFQGNYCQFPFTDIVDNFNLEDDANLCSVSSGLDLEAKSKSHKKHKQKYQYQFAIAAIFQNEARFMKEWIEFYKMNGVDHFYMYNNRSTDDYAAVLAPYVAVGEVELIDWNAEGKTLQEYDKLQINAYRDALSRARGKTKWLGVLDLDEYVVINKKSTILEFLNSFEEMPGYGGLCFPWVFFGTSHIEKVPQNMLLIEALTMNGGKAAGGNLSAIWNMGAYKSIAKVDCIKDVASPHYFAFHNGIRHEMARFDQAQINHYWAGDLEYFEKVKIPRRLAWGQCEATTRAWEAGMNQYNDLSTKILKFVPELRRRVGFRH